MSDSVGFVPVGRVLVLVIVRIVSDRIVSALLCSGLSGSRSGLPGYRPGYCRDSVG